MTIKKKPDGKYLLWYFDREAKGRARKRAQGRPKRDLLAVMTALEKSRLSYCREVSFWNELHVGKQMNLDGGLQWVDIVAHTKPRALPIILDDPRKRYHKYEKVALKNKIKGLIERGLIPLVLPAGKTSQEYWMQILMHMRLNKLRGV